MLIKHNLPIILASASKVRKEILASCGLSFEVINPLYDEDREKKFLVDKSPKELAIFLAREKALSVSKIYPQACVIGADQVCEFEGRQLFKSNNPKDALEQLQTLNGKQHFQNNCSVVALGGKILLESFSLVKLVMRNNSVEQLKRYVEFDEPWGCAGSYKYESFGKHLFAEVDGDYFAILGLNIQPILSFLHHQNFINL